MTSSETQSTPLKATVIQLSVPDMTCGHCAATIHQSIQRLDAQASVAVDLAAKTVRVETLGLDAKGVMAALEEAGFTPEHVLAS